MLETNFYSLVDIPEGSLSCLEMQLAQIRYELEA